MKTFLMRNPHAPVGKDISYDNAEVTLNDVIVLVHFPPCLPVLSVYVRLTRVCLLCWFVISASCLCSCWMHASWQRVRVRVHV